METLTLDKPYLSRSLEETERLAADFFGMINPNGLAALYGPLGGGKTAFVRGLAKAAGVDPDDVTSPTFTLINEYHGGRMPIYHFDLYRLKSPAEFYGLGADDYLSREGIILIEWADKAADRIPADRYDIRFDIIDDNSRQLVFSRVNK